MATAILDGTNIDLSVFSYSAPKPNLAGGKVVNLYNKHSKEYLTISAPLMGAWSAQEGKTDKGVPNGKYTMSLQFSKGEYSTPETNKFLEQLKLLEIKVKEDAIVYSRDWFGKEVKNMDIMEEKFNPMLKYRKLPNSEEKNYDSPPCLTVKLPCWKNVWQTSVFDEDYNPLYIKGKSDVGVSPLDFLTTTSKTPMQVICLIQAGGIWIANGKASITWNLKQIIVRKPKTSAISDDTCFLTVKTSDREMLKKLPETEIEHNEYSVSALVQDSDGEEEYTMPLPNPVAPTPVAPTPVAPTPVAPTPVAPTPIVEPIVESVGTAVAPKKKVAKKVNKLADP
jgi:hypothetical protein